YAVNFGGGQVDITSGKFVFSAAEAYLIEDGKVGPAVKGATLIGNGPDILKARACRRGSGSRRSGSTGSRSGAPPNRAVADRVARKVRLCPNREEWPISTGHYAFIARRPRAPRFSPTCPAASF